MSTENIDENKGEHHFYGVCVKVQLAPKIAGQEALGEHRLQALWDNACENFWTDVQPQYHEEIAALKVNSVDSYGRCSGWAVPDPIIDPEERPEHFERFQELILHEVQEHERAFVANVERELENLRREETLRPITDELDAIRDIADTLAIAADAVGLSEVRAKCLDIDDRTSEAKRHLNNLYENELGAEDD